MRSYRTTRQIRMRTYRFSRVGENEMIVYNPATLAATAAGGLAKTATTYLLGKIGNALFSGRQKSQENKMPQINVQPRTVYDPTPEVVFDGNRHRANGLAVSGELYRNGVSGGTVNGKDLQYTPKKRQHNRIHIAN